MGMDCMEIDWPQAGGYYGGGDMGGHMGSNKLFGGFLHSS